MKLLQHYSLILVLIIFSACSETNSVDMNNKTDNSTRQKFLAQIKQYNWNEPDKVFDMIEPAISFEAYSIKPSIGSSKLGGQPDLPKE